MPSAKVTDLRELLDGKHYVFLCFMPDRYQAVKTLLCEQMKARL